MIDFTSPNGIFLIGVIAVGLILLYVFVLKGIFIIRDNQVGVLKKKFGGKSMPQGQVIARKGQVGMQAQVLQPNIYWRFPLFWEVKKFPITDVPQDEVGVVEAIDGTQMPKGRVFGDEIAQANHFQDGEAFLEGGGVKGQQVGILTTGKYRLNPVLFNVKTLPATIIGSQETGIVTANDGKTLESNYRIAPEPERDFQHFQNGQAFIDGGGYRGVQLQTLQTGKYFLNSLLFSVQKISVYEVPTGNVSVLRSNVGVEATEVVVGKGTVEGADNDAATAEVEKVLVTDNKRRGIVSEPLKTGIYNLNTVAYSGFLVPTSAIMVDWASSDSPAGATMARPATTKDGSTRATRNDYPYLTDNTDNTTSNALYRFDELQVFSNDGFALKIAVRMVIRILPENAAYIIARFGTPYNLIQQIVHPLIESSFRISAGSKKALEFYQSRAELQAQAFAKAQETFKEYKVIAQGLLLNDIEFADDKGRSLLDTQNQKEIALQQQAQFVEMAKAQDQRIAVETKKATADKQPAVVQSALDITINANNAQAKIKTAEGDKASVIINSEGTMQQLKNQADGQAALIQRTGEAQATAYRLQQEAMGKENIALINVMDRVKDGKVKIVPDTLINTGGEDGSNNGLLMGVLVKMLQGQTLTQPQPSTSDKKNVAENY